MITKHLVNQFLKVFEHSPTADQSNFFDNFASFLVKTGKAKVFLLTGYAGTGKTSVVSAIVKSLKSLNLNSVLLAPTGRAAKVFAQYAEATAYTIHKKIYRQQSSSDGFGRFALNRNLHKDTLFIVDESSMISVYEGDSSVFGTGNLLEDLIQYVYAGKNCQLVLIGDTAQLPPIGFDVSPALDYTHLLNLNLDVIQSNLTMVVRQSEGSFILQNATTIRNDIINSMFFDKFPKFIHNNKDVIRLSGENLIDEINNSYDKYGIENVIVINRSNKRANKYNEGIRTSILYRDSKISTGDFIMIVKNNYFWGKEIDNLDFIANGDIAEIIKIYDYQDLYGFKFADVRLSLIDYNIELNAKILLDTLDSETASLSTEDNKRLFYTIMEDYQDVSRKKQRIEKIKENPYFNALQVKFAYAITCHKAQGGQWPVVFLDQGYITKEMLNKEYLRWMYTAFTRAVDKIYLVNFPKDYFDE